MRNLSFLWPVIGITGVGHHTAQGHVLSPSQETGGDPVTWAVPRSRLHTAGIRWLRGNSEQFPRPGLEEAAAGRPSARPTSSKVYTTSEVTVKSPHTAGEVTIVKSSNSCSETSEFKLSVRL